MGVFSPSHRILLHKYIISPSFKKKLRDQGVLNRKNKVMQYSQHLYNYLRQEDLFWVASTLLHLLRSAVLVLEITAQKTASAIKSNAV